MSLPSLPSPPAAGFSPEQKEYLQGFFAGAFAAGSVPFVGLTSAGLLTASAPEAATGNLASEPTVHGTPLADLCKEERWKYDENPLDGWERLSRHAEADMKPDGEHTYRFKTFGLFYVAPTQDSFMMRLRVPACELTSVQLKGLADIAQEFSGGVAHITTRGNFQIREIAPKNLIKVLTRVQDLGLTSRGAGADNIRNITASPNSGFDPDEVLDVRAHAKALHHYILNHRDLYGLPRKFNVAFDNGGSLSAAVDTNDIGFFACRVTEASLAKAPGTSVTPGEYFRVWLGGISGHGDLAKDTGLLIRPGEAVAVSAAMIRVFSEAGDRTNRKKARLKYVLEKWGVERFLEETQRKLSFPLQRLPLEACESRKPTRKHGWIGPAKQSQKGLWSLGVGVPVGKLTSRQMHGLADLAAHFGKGEIRLTVWQNLLLPHIPEAFLSTVERSVRRLGFFTESNGLAGGVIACTGSRGCKYAAADTKGHAVDLIKRLGNKIALDQPVNVHFTGCPHSCAQHYCGDLGFIGAKLPDGREGYHLVVGGGMDEERGIGRELFRGLAASEVPTVVERVLTEYLARRSPGESFVAWARRHPIGDLQTFFS
ncbi:NirA family protein [Nibricoccus sp. IMCC34717]|uniref:NirA family protein n=1 Tax=Nibricoccus sp. IMCC34717 TaxID=3034021 RepID=UPI00384CCD52